MATIAGLLGRPLGAEKNCGFLDTRWIEGRCHKVSVELIQGSFKVGTREFPGRGKRVHGVVNVSWMLLQPDFM